MSVTGVPTDAPVEGAAPVVGLSGPAQQGAGGPQGAAAAVGSKPKREIVAIGGGKGGIGKSLLAANMGVHLALSGRKVVLIDADLGGANLHTCLGVKPPTKTLSDFVNRKVTDLAQVVAPTNLDNLGLVSGALDLLGAANPKYTQKLRLLREVVRLDVDTVIIDLGGGTGFNILDFFLIADHGVLTVVPEPTSIENAYRFIKAAYYRRLKTAEIAWNLRPLVEQAMEDSANKGLKTPADLVAYVETRSPEGGSRLRAELERFPLKLVVNQTRGDQERKIGFAIADACQKYFGIRMDYLGAIPFDDAVWQSVRRRQPVVLADPEGAASRSIVEITGALGLVS